MRTRHTSLLALLVGTTMIAAACGERARGGENAGGGTNALSVTDISVGRTINADLTIGEETSTFRPADVIYASIETAGAGPGTLGVRWIYQDSKDVHEGTRDIRPVGPTRTEFHLRDPNGLTEGRYRLEVTLNGASAGSKEFEVKR